jgi:3-hydroxybutyryl-CoA dehydrogenase
MSDTSPSAEAPSPIRKVLVLGTGTMGQGIAQVTASAGLATNLYDIDAARVEKAIGVIRGVTERLVQKGKMTEEARRDLLGMLVPSSDLAHASDGVDLVIEAVPESLELKQRLFAEIEGHVDRATILASNTSSLSISEIARPLRYPERGIGLHFFNPVPVMRLLEIVRGAATDDTTLARSREFAAALGKTSIVVRDSPGFATSRLGVALGLEAIRMLEQGVASAEDIDRAMELGYNHPVGPLRLTDMVGLDVRLAIAEHLYTTLKNDTFRPPALLRAKVRQGQLGKKTGEGFYRWEKE